MDEDADVLELLEWERKGRRSGGHIVHIVQIKSASPRLAICGAQPKRSMGARFTRTDWWVTNKDVTCKACLRILDERKQQ